MPDESFTIRPGRKSIELNIPHTISRSGSEFSHISWTNRRRAMFTNEFYCTQTTKSDRTNPNIRLVSPVDRVCVCFQWVIFLKLSFSYILSWKSWINKRSPDILLILVHCRSSALLERDYWFIYPASISHDQYTSPADPHTSDRMFLLQDSLIGFFSFWVFVYFSFHLFGCFLNIL